MLQKKLVRILIVTLCFSLILGGLSTYAGALSDNGLLLEGAQIRTEGVQGIRFVAKIDKTHSLVCGENANFGILLIPQSMIAGNEMLTIDTVGVKNVVAKNILAETEEYYEFTAVLTNIPSEFYGTDIVARAYVNENGSYTYSNQLSRSVRSVAQMILDDEGASETDVAVANEVIATYNLVGNDITVDADIIWNGPSELITYPEYPEQIARDHMYSVSVEQKNVQKSLVVYNQTEEYFYQNRFSGGDINRRFCEFAFIGAQVTVNIKVNTDFNTYSVIPTSKGFASSYSNGVISVTLDKPEYFVVILDDDVNTALAVFADNKETDVPQKTDSKVVYVEGWNQITINDNVATLENGVLTMNTNGSKLYIAPGAVLNARVVTANVNDSSMGYGIKIYGRGAIVDPFSNIYEYDPSTTTSKHLVRIGGYATTVQDIKLLDARCFNLNVNRGTGTIKNVKILSSMMTSDGITTTADNGVVKDCFIYCGDNALVAQVGSGSTGYSFENITIGTTCSAIYPQYYANSTFTDIYVFRADEGLVSLKHGDGSSHQKYITINNLDALDCVRTPWLFYAEDQGSAEKIINMNGVKMRYTTGEANVSASIGTSTNEKTLFRGKLLSTGSNFTLNISDLYVGGNLITNDSQVKTTYFSGLTKNYSSSGNAPEILQGDVFSANYVYDRKVLIGSHEVLFENAPIVMNGEWYLPYDEIVPLLCVQPTSANTMVINGIKLISLTELQNSGAVVSGTYNNTTKAIHLTAAVNSNINLLKDDYGRISNYNAMYYTDRTPYIRAYQENSVWVYNAKLANYDAGIVRMITDVYRQYGAGTYTIAFDYKASESGSFKVDIAVDHSASKYSKSLTANTAWQSCEWTVSITENAQTLELMALTFKPGGMSSALNDADISIRNISMTKVS